MLLLSRPSTQRAHAPYLGKHSKMSDDEGSDRGSDAAPDVQTTYTVGEETEVPNTDGKLFKTVAKEGEGPLPPNGAKVTVHYTGTLEKDGSKFDSSRDRDDPFEFTLGRNSVIKGWEKGVATMRKGERATLKILSEYGYGAGGSPPKIPGGATLLFDIELLDWTKLEDVSANKDKSIMKNVRLEGQGWTHPEYESTVDFTIKVVEPKSESEDGKEIVGETDLMLIIGEAEEDTFPAAIEDALKGFKKGETASIDVAGSIVKADYPKLGIKAGQRFRAVITVKDFTTVHTYDFQGAAKIDEAIARKEAGNAYFAKHRWALAVRKYERALEFIESDYGLEGDALDAAKKLRAPCYTNAAQALINQGDFRGAIAKCDKCLETDANNVKALFRRAKAKNALGDWEEAKPDLRRVLELEPGNADAVREWAAVKEKDDRQKALDKARYGNMFSKLAAMEEKEKQ
jgi:FK506-binding protein 4/5